MSLLQDIMNNTPNPVVVPAGRQYELVVKSAQFGATKGGKDEMGEEKKIRPMVTLFLGISEERNAKIVSEYLWFPVKGDDSEVALGQSQKIKKVLECLEINPEEDGDVDLDSFLPGMDAIKIPTWRGKRGFAILGIQERNQEQFNVVSSWIRQFQD